MKIIWKSVPTFPDLEASSDGQIRSIDRVITRVRKEGLVKYNMKGRILKQMWSGGYWTVTVKTDRYENRTQRPESVHRLVCLAFKSLPPPDKPLACHSDDDKDNNTPSNLNWGDFDDNRTDAMINNRAKGPPSKLNEKQRIKLIKMYETGRYYQRDLAKKFGLSQAGVSHILNK